MTGIGIVVALVVAFYMVASIVLIRWVAINLKSSDDEDE
jgi:hypothetical protein